MTIYAPTDVQSISIPVERGGCGQPHEPDEDRTITCPQCEPHIVGARHGFSHDPTGVSLTPDEIREVEHAEALAAREKARTWSSPEHLRAALFGAQPAVGKAPSLLEQIAALPDHERAALAAMLGAPSAPAQEVVGEPDRSAAKPGAETPKGADAPAKTETKTETKTEANAPVKPTKRAGGKAAPTE